MIQLERWLEGLLWKSGALVLVGAGAGLLIAVAALYMGTVDVVHLLGRVVSYGRPGMDSDARAALRSQMVV